MDEERLDELELLLLLDGAEYVLLLEELEDELLEGVEYVLPLLEEPDELLEGVEYVLLLLEELLS